MFKGTVLTVAVVMIASFCFANGHTPPPPPTVEAGSCLASYTQYPTIQAAVDAATAGGTVLVCPGTYPEQITITKNLTLKGITAGNATGARIVPPITGMTLTVPTLVIGGFLTPIAPQVLVQTAKSANFVNLTVDGTNDGIASCSPYLVGILFQNASGSLSYMSVVNQILGPGLTGCQGGLGILVQSGGGLKSVVDVADSVVQNFAKNGITGTEVGTKLTMNAPM